MMEDLKYIPPYNFWHQIRTGAIQEIELEKLGNDIIYFKKSSFFVYVSYHDNNRVIRKNIPEELAENADWSKIISLWNNLDNTKLPSRTDIERKDFIELLVPLGVFSVQQNPNIIINGVPQTSLILNDEYKYIPKKEDDN